MTTTIRFPKTHYIKSVNPSFRDMKSGKKRFEVFIDPSMKKFQVGDIVIFEEYNESMRGTGDKLTFCIEYVYLGDFFLQGFIIVGLSKQLDQNPIQKAKNYASKIAAAYPRHREFVINCLNLMLQHVVDGANPEEELKQFLLSIDNHIAIRTESC